MNPHEMFKTLSAIVMIINFFILLTPSYYHDLSLPNSDMGFHSLVLELVCFLVNLSNFLLSALRINIT